MTPQTLDIKRYKASRHGVAESEPGDGTQGAVKLLLVNKLRDADTVEI